MSCYLWRRLVVGVHGSNLELWMRRLQVLQLGLGLVRVGR